MAELTNNERSQIENALKDLGTSSNYTPLGDAYVKALLEFSTEAVDRIKKHINKNTNGSGALAQSVVPVVGHDKVDIEADFYYNFIDKGVRAAPTKAGYNMSKRTPFRGSSEFKFKNLKVSRAFFNSIRSIVSGDKGKVFAVMINIKKFGIHPKNLTDQAIQDRLLNDISEKLAEVTGIAVEFAFDNTLNK